MTYTTYISHWFRRLRQRAGWLAGKLTPDLSDKFELLVALAIWGLIIFSLLHFSSKYRPPVWNFIWDTINPNASPTPAPAPKEGTHEDLEKIAQTEKIIVDSINNRRFADIAPLLEDKVEVTVVTKDTKKRGKEDVIKDLTKLGPFVPYDFEQRDPFIMNLKIKNSSLAEEFIGEAHGKAPEQLVAFNIEPSGKIDKIQISVSWKLYNF